jgi:hypothetical protein
MSGSLVDALVNRKPVVAAEDSAAGDAVTALRIGATYVSGSSTSLAAAIEATCATSGDVDPDPGVLAHHGFLGAQGWARALLELADVEHRARPG